MINFSYVIQAELSKSLYNFIAKPLFLQKDRVFDVGHNFCWTTILLRGCWDDADVSIINSIFRGDSCVIIEQRSAGSLASSLTCTLKLIFRYTPCPINLGKLLPCHASFILSKK